MFADTTTIIHHCKHFLLTNGESGKHAAFSVLCRVLPCSRLPRKERQHFISWLKRYKLTFGMKRARGDRSALCPIAAKGETALHIVTQKIQTHFRNEKSARRPFRAQFISLPFALPNLPFTSGSHQIRSRRDPHACPRRFCVSFARKFRRGHASHSMTTHFPRERGSVERVKAAYTDALSP